MSVLEETLNYGPNWNGYRPMTMEKLREEVAAALQVEIEIRGSDEGLPTVDELIESRQYRSKEST